MRDNFCVILLFLFIVFTSCDSSHVYDEYKSLSNGWDKDSSVEFNITSPDTSKQYNLFLNVRNTSDYKYSNLFLIVETNYPNGKSIKDTLEYMMAKPNGEFLGTGFSDLKENKFWYKKEFKFTENGNYKIKIQHAMRENGNVQGIEVLEGISDVGFRIEKSMH